jgi:hypothetical protein
VSRRSDETGAPKRPGGGRGRARGAGVVAGAGGDGAAAGSGGADGEVGPPDAPASTPPEEPEPAPAVPPPRPEPVRGPLAARGDDEELRRKRDEVRFADYFAILELDPDGPLPEGAVDLAWQRLVQRFDPARHVGRSTPDVEEALAEIRDGLADAREVLGDRLLRERYRRSIRGERGGPSGGAGGALS